MSIKPLITLLSLVGTAPATPASSAQQKPELIETHVVAVQTRVGTFLCTEKVRPELERAIAGEVTAQKFYAWAGD
jgi:hypothetical protein